MNSNNALEALKSQVGKTFDKSPSALTVWLGGRLLFVNEGEVHMEFEVRPEMTNPIGTMHGGIMAAIMDDMIGIVVFTLGEPTFNTSVNLNVDFFYPGKKGEKVIAKAKVIKAGARLKNAQCELFSESGKLIAKGYSNMFNAGIPIQK